MEIHYLNETIQALSPCMGASAGGWLLGVVTDPYLALRVCDKMNGFRAGQISLAAVTRFITYANISDDLRTNLRSVLVGAA